MIGDPRLDLEKAFGGSAGLWLQMQVNHDLARVRQHLSGLTIRRFAPKVA